MRILSYLIGCLLLLTACETSSGLMQATSPNGAIQLSFFLLENGQPAYTLAYKNQTVLDTSLFGLAFRSAEELQNGLIVQKSQVRDFSEVWEMPWGEQREVENTYQELSVELVEAGGDKRGLKLVFRVYDDGMGFRYELPAQPGVEELTVMDEFSRFQLSGDHQSWWIPGDWDIYEHLYNETPLSKINAIAKRDHPNLAQTYIPFNAVNTPFTMKTAEGLYLSFHEAALTDYPGMTLKVDTVNLALESELVGRPDDAKADISLPFKSPWRTIQVADRAGDLIESNLIVNLNEPSKIDDMSWFTPMTYAGIWWEMHLGKSDWSMESGKHGATTANAKRYIDFCAENNIAGLLVEGWNTGWDRWIGFDDREGVFDFITPYADYDLEEVVRYANEKGVEMIMHHETSAAPRTYEQQMDTAFKLMQRLGIHAVKTGYVGKIIPAGERHHGQWMVRHYRKVLETAAKYQIAVNAHEPIKATGIRRTWPNAISREGLRGQEFNAWSIEKGNPPGHLPTVAFTRMLAGPIDFTPGIFNIKLIPWKEGQSQINTTLAQQLALYVVIYSPVQMAADLPEYYENQPGFQFIRDVAVDWEESRVINGEPGDYVSIARKERNGDRWFLGSISDEEGRVLPLTLDFLDADKKYRASIYEDGEGAHWDENPLALQIRSEEVDANTHWNLKLAPGGGVAVMFEPI